MDNFCLAHGYGIRAGYPSTKLLRSSSRAVRRQIRGRVIIALTANSHYALDGIRPRARVRSLTHRLARDTAFRIGRNTWYVLRHGRSDGLLKVQRGRVQEVGILARQVSRSRGTLRRVLHSFPDA